MLLLCDVLVSLATADNFEGNDGGFAAVDVQVQAESCRVFSLHLLGNGACDAQGIGILAFEQTRRRPCEKRPFAYHQTGNGITHKADLPLEVALADDRDVSSVMAKNKRAVGSGAVREREDGADGSLKWHLVVVEAVERNFKDVVDFEGIAIFDDRFADLADADDVELVAYGSHVECLLVL
jgi:hypothetical protein